MSWYGIDAVEKAISRTRKALFEPFEFWKWVKFAVITFFLGYGSSNFGGSGNSYRMASEDFTNITSGKDVIPGYLSHNTFIQNILSSSFNEYVLLIVLIAAFILLILLFVYISNVMQFVFVESLVKNDVKLWAYFKKFLGKGFNLLIISLVILLAFLFLLVIATLPFLYSLSKNPSEPSWPLVLGGIFWTLGIVAVLVLLLIIINSFLGLAIPVSIYRNTGILSALRLIFAHFRKSWQQVLVYWGTRFVLGIIAGIIMLILILIVLLVSVLISLVIDGILYFLFSALTTEPWNWVLLIPFIIIELLLLFIALLLLNVPFTVFMKYHLLSFLETWFTGSDLPFFDATAPGTEIDFSGPETNNV